MEDLLIHDLSRAHLTSLLADPPHALLIVGAAGIGKLGVATAWGRQLTTEIEIVSPDDKGTISIDAVRGLYQRTRGKQAKHQVVIVDQAETMGIEAQNAFLKLLEEPRAGVTFVLTTPNIDVLLPTITSRTQSAQLLPVSDTQSKTWAQTLKKDISAQELTQLLFVSQGRPAMLKHLLSSEQAFNQHRDLMQQAKHLMSASLYDRLTMVGDLTKDRTSLIIVLEAMVQMTKLQLSRNPEPRWVRLADGLQTCLSRLMQNGNPRAQLLRLLMVY